MKIDYSGLSPSERREIDRLLSACPNDPPKLEDIWQMMDDIWDELGCSNTSPDPACLQEFYAHLIWTLNGLFIEQHQLSLRHRNAVADWVVAHNLESVLDYGGGFGTLARLIAQRNSAISIDVFEPHPSHAALGRADAYPSVQYVTTLSGTYDCTIAMDVLEHVPDPLALLAEVVDTVRAKGFLLIANHFRPSTKCHLPATFHLRYTFKLFARLMGLRVVGPCPESHATVYEAAAARRQNRRLLRSLEAISRIVFPVLDATQRVRATIRGLRS